MCWIDKTVYFYSSALCFYTSVVMCWNMCDAYLDVLIVIDGYTCVLNWWRLCEWCVDRVECVARRSKVHTSIRHVHQQTSLTARQWQSELGHSRLGLISRKISTNFLIVCKTLSVLFHMLLCELCLCCYQKTSMSLAVPLSFL